MIQHGQLQLVSIRYSPSSFTIGDDGNDSQYYSSDTVYGEFCDYNVMLNKHNPAVYSTAHAVMGTSEHCNEHRYMIPLRDVMTAVQLYDDAHSCLKTIIISRVSQEVGVVVQQAHQARPS